MWTHVLLNYQEPNDPINVYYGGIEASITKGFTAYPFSAGDGRIVLGRRYTGNDEEYASVQVDELTFFNQALTPDQISTLAAEA